MESLSTERWQQIDALLDEALNLDVDGQRAFLDGIEEAGLRAAVGRLLDAEAHAPAFLDAEAADYAVPLLPDLPEAFGEADSPPGRRIGAYRLEAEIGRGGMGRVFLAERADGAFEQTVALKLLRADLDPSTGQAPGDAERRFRAERQILASLDHPHIARLLAGGGPDPGPGPAGQPYLAMEYVDGAAIDAYCDERHLSIDERLRLFTTVGEAVHHAHRNLVVHRDLKPSNVFVTPEGEVKLLDFGIAKLLDEEGGPVSAPLTQTGQRWMTPEYAAPEQVRGEAVTTATDVYQLGVVLYELLTGHRPFEPGGGGLRGVEQAVLETEPEKPSTAVSRATGSGAAESRADEVSRARGTQPERLRRTLQGDLDTIVLKALSKEPEARYASAEAFVEDVKRYLAGLPVEARKPTAGYRMRRFVRRHRVGVAAAAAVVLALVGGLGAALWQAQVARAERDQAETLAVFLEDLLAASNPLADERLDTLRVSALVTRGQAQIETEFQDRPVLQARMLHMIGRTYSGMHRYVEAEQVLERALALRRTHLGSRHEDTARTLRELGLVRGGLNYDGATGQETIPLFREALLLLRQRLAPTDPELAMTMMYLARALMRTGSSDFGEADSLLHEALTIQQQPAHRQTLQTMLVLETLAESRQRRGDLEGEAAFGDQALDLAETIFGEEHLYTTNVRAARAFGLLGLGRYEEAERQARDALSVLLEVRGDTSRYVIQTRRTLGSALRGQGRYDESRAVLSEALAASQRSSERTLTLGSLATLLWEQGDLVGAEEAQREVVALSREQWGADQPTTAFSTGKLADILIEQRRYAEAERMLLDGLRPLQAAHGHDDHGSVQMLLRKLVLLYDAWGKPDQAARYRAQLVDDPGVAPH